MFRFLLIISMFFLSSLSVAKSKDWGNAVYSNVRLIKAEGDLIGWRFQVIHSNRKNFILLQAFEGEPLAPCLAAAEIQRNLIKAKLPDDCSYNGIISGEIKGGKMFLDFSSVENSGRKKEMLLLIN